MMPGIRKIKSRGFSLTELLIIVVILGILAATAMLALGRSQDNAKAAAIMADLESAKNALLAYSMEYRTRNSDPLVEFVSVTNILTSLDKYMDAGPSAGYFAALSVKKDDDDGFLKVGYEDLTRYITPGIKNALEKKIDDIGGEYTQDLNGAYSIWLRIR